MKHGEEKNEVTIFGGGIGDAAILFGTDVSLRRDSRADAAVGRFSAQWGWRQMMENAESVGGRVSESAQHDPARHPGDSD
jgi:hypothetical protein